MSVVSKLDELPDAKTAKNLAISNSEIFSAVTSYIDSKIRETISSGKFSWKSSSDIIDSFIRTKTFVENDSGALVEKFILSKSVVKDGSRIDELVNVLTPFVRERYESKGYKFEISDDYVLEISFV